MQDTIPATSAAAMPATLLEPAGAAPPPAIDDWQEGLRIGPFILKKRLGRGGMGVVWLAEQIEPLQRLVAIKVMTWDDGGPMARAMFELERQALAQLSHRAIAQIYDAGRLPDGALFFAMEYVPGVALHRYVREQRPDLKTLATLMIDLCLGVQHAHQRNLIHRDIKPGNILVQQVDGAVLPRLIDFGIAMSSQAGSKANSGAGTPGYMSPEQQQPGPKGIDQRSDVYGLGAVLAECLCRLAGVDNPPGGFDSVHARAVLQQTLGRGRRPLPPEPDRRVALDQLSKQPQELRAIARKALDPEREQRYDSADAMAQDLRRWLEHRPVQALPGTRGYQLRCYLRRHALASVAAAVVLVAIVVGLGMALFGLSEARSGRAQAVAALALAEQRRSDAEGLVEFMLGDFAEKLRTIGRLDLLDAVGQRALAYLAKEQVEETEDSATRRARAYRTIADVQVFRNQKDAALESLLKAQSQLQPWLRTTRNAELVDLAADVAFRLGRQSFSGNDLDATEKLWRQQLELARRAVVLAPDSSEGKHRVSNALLNLAVLEAHQERQHIPAALDYVDESIAIKSALIAAGDGAIGRELANAWAWRGSMLLEQGRDAEGWENLQRALAVLDQDPVTQPADASRLFFEAEIRQQVALAALDLGLEREAEQLQRRALALSAAAVAIDSTNLRTQGNLARIALRAALLSADPASVLKPHRHLIDRCLAQEECTQRFAKELEALELQLRWRMGKAVDPAEATALLSVMLGDRTKLELLQHAVAIARHLHDAGQLTTGLSEQLAARLDAIPESFRKSLRFALARLALLRMNAQHAAEIPMLESQVRERRQALARFPGVVQKGGSAGSSIFAGAAAFRDGAIPASARLKWRATCLSIRVPESGGMQVLTSMYAISSWW